MKFTEEKLEKAFAELLFTVYSALCSRCCSINITTKNSLCSLIAATAFRCKWSRIKCS